MLGHSVPAGSKDVGVAYRTDKTTGAKIPIVDGKGRIRVYAKDSSGRRGEMWRAQVALAGQRTMDGRELFTGPLYVELTIVRPRPLGHFGRGRNAGKLLPSAPAYPGVMPDVLKLTRGTEDALTGVVWRDDSTNIALHIEKVSRCPRRAPKGRWSGSGSYRRPSGTPRRLLTSFRSKRSPEALTEETAGPDTRGRPPLGLLRSNTRSVLCCACGSVWLVRPRRQYAGNQENESGGLPAA